MLEKVSRHIALRLIKSGILKDDSIDLYSYAIQYLLLIIIPTINFTAYCIATQKILIGLIELFSFLLIRKYSGGYHCESSSVCLVFSTIILIFMAWLSYFIQPSLIQIIILLICEIELLIKGPIISVNHNVSSLERKRYHIYIFIILFIYNLIYITFRYLHIDHYSNCIMIVISCCSISHITCLFGKNKELYY